MKSHYVIAIHLITWLTNFYDFRFKEQQQQELEYTQLKHDYHRRWILKMQSGREDTLEERYSIKFCFKLRKKCCRNVWNASDCFSCMNRASVFEWHKRFKEGRESVRDEERCGRSKEVRTPELIGQIKNFMDKDHRVSIETINAQFDVSVETVHIIICEELKICAKFVSRVLREDQKERGCHDSREMVELINSDPTVLDALVTCNESWIYCFDPETKRQNSQWKHAGSPRPKKARQSKSTHKLLMILFFWQHWHDLHALGSHWTDSQQGILCWGFKGVQEESPLEEASTLQTMRTMHQSATPSLSQAIWPGWASRQFLSLPIVQTLLPVTFAYSLSSEAVVMWQLRRWKRLWRSHWHVHTRGLPWGLEEVVGTVEQVHCSWRRLLHRGLEFHVCTINKSAHKKKVWKLI